MRNNLKMLILGFALFALLLNANAQFTKLVDFDYFNTGGYPFYGALVFEDNALFGMNSNGGDYFDGVIFRMNTDGTGFTKLYDFNGDDPLSGATPEGGLISDGIYLYGMTKLGGANSFGAVFKIKLDGTDYTNLLDFNSTENGRYPRGSLFLSGDVLYGDTESGGLNDDGTIFKVGIDGSDATVLFNFDRPTGGIPYGSLIGDGTYLYGLTVYGGSHDFGVVFKVKYDGSDYTNMLDFDDDPHGAFAYGSLIIQDDILYGITNSGGVPNRGTIFGIKKDGTDYFKLLEFDNTNGAQPLGSLVSDGTYFYGMAELGGANYLGTMYKLKPDGSDLALLLDFDGPNTGSLPFGTLTYNNGIIYGMTNSGGIYDYGAVFSTQVSEPVAIQNNNNNKEQLIYPNPNNGSFNVIVNSFNTSINTTITISNILGNVVYEQRITNNVVSFSLPYAEPGIYFVDWRCNGQHQITKMVVAN